MKVAVVGNGNVGIGVFKELQNVREVHEIALVGRNILVKSTNTIRMPLLSYYQILWTSLLQQFKNTQEDQQTKLSEQELFWTQQDLDVTFLLFSIFHLLLLMPLF